MHPIWQGNSDKAPGPAAIRRRCAEQRCTVKDLDRTVRHGAAAQRQDRWDR